MVGGASIWMRSCLLLRQVVCDYNVMLKGLLLPNSSMLIILTSNWVVKDIEEGERQLFQVQYIPVGIKSWSLQFFE